MPSTMWFRVSLCLIGISFTACAQKFKDPTKDELQMTSDPRWPNVAGIFLNRDVSTDNFSHFVSEYARIKILTEAGKEWATVKLPYTGGGTPPSIEGRTIHPDGTIFPLTGSAESLLATKQDSQHDSAKSFTLPSVEVGSIIEYRWTLPSSEVHTFGVTNDLQGFYDSALAGTIPYWDVQTPLPVRKERFYYNPLGDLERNVLGNQGITHVNSRGEVAHYLLFSARLPSGVHLQPSPNRDYTLDLTDVPPIRHEENAPPDQSRIFGVRFYYSPYLAGDVFWTSEGKLWAKELDRASEPTSELREATAKITAGASTDDEKARKLYEAIQAIENVDFSRKGSEAGQGSRGVRNPTQVLSEKSGTPNEIAILYLALARAAGLQARPMSVADRRKQIFDPGYLSLDQLTATLVVLRINGGEIFVDPGEKLMPYGQLHWAHSLSGGLLETADGTTTGALTPSNLSKDAITAHTADLNVDGQGKVTGSIKLIVSGPKALEWQQLNLTADPAVLRREVSGPLAALLPEQISAEMGEIQGLGSSNGYVSVSARIEGLIGTLEGKRMLLPAFLFSTRDGQFAVAEQREAPIDLHYSEQVIDDAVYHLPQGFVLESAPQPVQLAWPEHAALVVKTQPGAGVIEIKHIFARASVLMDAKEYAALRDYYQKMAATNQQRLVLSSAAMAAQN